MFGGFDGEFFNDINTMDLSANSLLNKSAIQESTKDRDFSRIVNCFEDHDIVFNIKGTSGFHSQRVYANKALVLYRAIEKEVEIHHKNMSPQITVFK